MGRRRHRKRRMRAYRRGSDIGRVLIPLAALTVAASRGDGDAAAVIAGRVLGATLLSKSLKALLPEERPDGSNSESFPSDHMAETVAASVSLGRTSGWRFGGAA